MNQSRTHSRKAWMFIVALLALAGFSRANSYAGTGDVGQGNPCQGNPGQVDQGQVAQGKPDQGKPDQGDPAQCNPGQVEQGKPDQGYPDQGKPDQGYPGQYPGQSPGQYPAQSSMNGYYRGDSDQGFGDCTVSVERYGSNTMAVTIVDQSRGSYELQRPFSSFKSAGEGLTFRFSERIQQPLHKDRLFTATLVQASPGWLHHVVFTWEKDSILAHREQTLSCSNLQRY